MVKPLVSFLVKATPRAVGELLKPGKKTTKIFKDIGGKLAKNKTYQKFEKGFEKVFDEKPGSFAKSCFKEAVQGQVVGAISNVISGGFNIFSRKSKQYNFPQARSSSGSYGTKMPGIDVANSGQQQNIKSFNNISKSMDSLNNKAAELSKNQKKIISNYRKSFSSQQKSLPELLGLGTRLEQDLVKSKSTLTRGLESGNHEKKINQLNPFKRLKTPSVKSEEAKEIVLFTRDALEDVSDQLTQNMKKINDNLNKTIVEMNKKEEEMALKMMSNLGNYNIVTYKKLSDTITQTENISFKKQQESSFEQTELLVDKLDNSFDFNSKSVEAIRSEIMSNTQAMYELDKQNRVIDETYRALEEKNNNGITLPTIYSLLRQVSERVQYSLKTPDVINENVRDAMNSIAYSAGYELGAFVQTLKEIFNGIIVSLEKIHMKIYKSNIPFKDTVLNITGTVFKALEWVNKSVFSGLLGADDSVVRDMFGSGGDYTLEGLENKAQDNIASEVSSSEMKNQNQISGFSKYDSNVRLNSAGHNKGNLTSDIDGLFRRGNKLYARTKSGFYTEVKDDKKSGETEESFKNRKLQEALKKEYEEIIEDRSTYGKYKDSRDNGSIASRRYANQIQRLEEKLVISPKNDMTIISNIGNKSITYSQINKTFINMGRLKTLLNFAGSKKVITIDPEFKLLILKLLREASKRGIRYIFTDVLRLPKGNYSSLSAHMLGLAVDISIECTRNGVERSMSDLLRKYWVHNANPPVSNPNRGYLSVTITLEDLSMCVHEKEKYLKTKDGKIIDDYDFDIIYQWYEFLVLAGEYGISVGATRYSTAFENRFGVSSKKGVVLDLVHLAMAGNRSTIDLREVADLNIMAHDNLQESTRGFGDNLFKSSVEAQREVIISQQVNDNISNQIQSFEKGMSEKYGDGLVKKGNTLYYTDYDERGRQYKVKDYVRDSEGNYQKRGRNNLNLVSEQNMLLYDKAKSGQLDKQTYEEMRKIVDTYENLNPNEKSKLSIENANMLREFKLILKEMGMDRPPIINNNIVNNNISTINSSNMTYSDDGNLKAE